MSSRKDHQAREDSGPLFYEVYQNADVSPEKRLWCAVLLQFLMDAQRDYYNFRGSMNGASRKLGEKLQGNIYEAEHEHMEMVCGLVGIEHSCFVKRVESIVTGVYEMEIKTLHG